MMTAMVNGGREKNAIISVRYLWRRKLLNFRLHSHYIMYTFFQLFPMAHVLKKTNSIAFSAMMEKKNF
jgi:hypothetical protein